MSENSSDTDFSSKKFYAIVALGLIIFAAGTIFAYPAGVHLDDPDISAEEYAKQEKIYAVSKVGSMVGFIIALIPSVKILQNSLLKEKEKAEKSNGKKETKDEKEETKFFK
ncbi:hypothetical protein MmiAt1_00560 [Methanimicrococcus sp. At1]|uniref:Uncharacterized protein n=1 Tax=Methanimicrococcus hacksteinii TaxID=3028293 RepID=A0ABU3VMF7_9EURY|nr:hypothetical protein [Methanimicrococcus sp. At1]MDV0444530.1 hypothetical protein [Methanimicrococcus sp. At1]